MNLKTLLIVTLSCLTLLPAPQAEAQSCSGWAANRQGLIARFAQRRAERRVARYETQSRLSSCSGSLAATTVSGCSGMMTTSGCGGGFASTTVRYSAPTVSYNFPQTQPVQFAPVQSVPETQRAPICIDGKCTVTQTTVTPSVQLMSPKPKSTALPPRPELFGLSASVGSNKIPSHILAQVGPSTTFGLGASTPKHILAQTAPVKVAESFKPSLVKAIANARKAGKISLAQAVTLRTCCLSPAFVERAHELAVTQIAMSGQESDAIPLDEEGVIQTEGINWEGLSSFLEVLIPLLITLLKAFGI